MNKEKTLVVGDFIDGSAIVYKKENMRLIKGLMFEDGSQKYFDFIIFGDFFDGLAMIDTRKKVGYINRKGEFVIPPEWLFGSDFSEERAFMLEDTTILVDTYGNVIKKFDAVFVPGSFNDGYAQIGEMSDDGNSIRTAYIDREGNQITPFGEFREIPNPNLIIDENEDYSCGLIRYKDKEKYGYSTIFQEIVIPAKYKFTEKFSENLALVYNHNDKAGFIDENGEVVIPFEFYFANSFSEGIAAVALDGKMGCIDRDLNVVIPFEFDYLGKCKNGMIDFCIDNKFGMMDLDCNIIIPEYFDTIRHFVDGICIVTLNHRQGVIDRNGNILFSDLLIGSEFNLLN